MLAVVLGLAALGAIERTGRAVVSRYLLPTAGAKWIWAPGTLERHQGLTFYAVRDFELDTPPERALVHVLADEAYLLYVNGRRVGSGAYAARAPLDSYPVGEALRPGWNRVAVELRSARGAGGLLLAIVPEGTREPLLRTGRDWRIFFDPTGLLDGTRPVADGEPALVWQSPPTGGWGRPRLTEPRAPFDDAVTRRAGRLEPEIVTPRPLAPALAEGSGQPILDFGGPVSGYVLLEGLAAAPRRLRIELGIERPNEDAVDILLAEGQGAWSAAEVRTLRYVAAHGLPEAASLGLVAVGPEHAAEAAERARLRSRGVFGVVP